MNRFLLYILGGRDWPELLHDLPALFIRTTLIFVLVLVVVRWTGKRTIASLAPFDLAVVIMIGEVAAIPLSDMRFDLLHGVVPVVLLGVFHVVLSTINLRSRRFEELTEGRRTQLVRHGRVLKQNLARERVSRSDLEAALRLQGVGELSEVEEAWMEHTGGISFVLRPEHRPLTAGDLLPEELDELLERRFAELRAEVRREARRPATVRRGGS